MEKVKMEIGRTDFNPIRDRYEIAGEIGRLACVSDDPCGDLRFLIQTCGKLYDMHSLKEKIDVDKLVLKVNEK